VGLCFRCEAASVLVAACADDGDRRLWCGARESWWLGIFGSGPEVRQGEPAHCGTSVGEASARLVERVSGGCEAKADHSNRYWIGYRTT
jgi:hypothetical protein